MNAGVTVPFRGQAGISSTMSLPKEASEMKDLKSTTSNLPPGYFI
ncbi:hypothetical protein HFO73_32475 [Rhizobium laguerreae]|nr:hypothetical protein [Rhizobium laguerreae]MBY3294445.1 hypothetical protein [Rhizobium laguerreae]MBY3327316.1 hypothetical protein [Rhizobium laguerreae]